MSGIYGPIGLSYLLQKRIGLSKLNFHKFKHDFRDTVKPKCPTNDGIEDIEHLLLLSRCFDVQQRVLAEVSQLVRPFVQINSLSKTVAIKPLLYGEKEPSNNV